MAQPPPDQNFYHPHAHPHAHPHHHGHPHPQLQVPAHFGNTLNGLIDDRNAGINYNYIGPYQLSKDDFSDPLVMRRPRRTRTTFTSAQITELEQHFLEGRYPTASRMAELSAKLQLGMAQVKIWFKNRRRRHKIQSDQQRDYMGDVMVLSPPEPTSGQSEANGNGSSSSGSGSSGGPPSLHSLSLNASNGSPSGRTNAMEQYVEPVFNHYYYNNNNHASHQQQVHHGHAPLSHPYAATAGGQYYTPPPTQQQQHQQEYPHHFQMQHKRQTTIKDDPDYNHDNPYFIKMPTAGAPAVNPVTKTAPPSSATSQNSEVYEPLTPKNDESSSLCSGNSGENNVDAGEEMNESKSNLRELLVSSNANSTDNASSNTNSVGDEAPSTPDINIMEDITGAFAKYQKLGDPNDPNYQCTMDTIMNAYNNHRNTSGNKQQFAYCFNKQRDVTCHSE